MFYGRKNSLLAEIIRGVQRDHRHCLGYLKLVELEFNKTDDNFDEGNSMRIKVPM